MNKEQLEEKKEWQKPEVVDLDINESMGKLHLNTETSSFGPS